MKSLEERLCDAGAQDLPSSHPRSSQNTSVVQYSSY